MFFLPWWDDGDGVWAFESCPRQLLNICLPHCHLLFSYVKVLFYLHLPFSSQLPWAKLQWSLQSSPAKQSREQDLTWKEIWNAKPFSDKCIKSVHGQVLYVDRFVRIKHTGPQRKAMHVYYGAHIQHMLVWILGCFSAREHLHICIPIKRANWSLPSFEMDRKILGSRVVVVFLCVKAHVPTINSKVGSWRHKIAFFCQAYICTLSLTRCISQDISAWLISVK